MEADRITDNYQQISQKIDEFCGKYQRKPGSVRLVAVGKVHGVEKILALAAAGQEDFAENYVQEAVQKIDFCRNADSSGANSIHWHFIGHIQSRKCRDIAENFEWVHTIDSEKVANRLHQYRQDHTDKRREPLNVLIQVNIDAEESKSGVSPTALPDLAKKVAALPNLRLRGLMIIPRASDNFSEQRAAFARCRQLLEMLNRNDSNLGLDQLSMGMTNDLEAAIAEGATMVRVGTALFGARPPKDGR